MEPKKPETMEERMQAIEQEFAFFKEDIVEGNAAMCQDIEKALAIGRQNEISIIQLPGKVIEELDKRGQGKRQEGMGWINIAIAAVLLLVALPAALESLGKLLSKLGGN